jgi:hypothetical protein
VLENGVLGFRVKGQQCPASFHSHSSPEVWVVGDEDGNVLAHSYPLPQLCGAHSHPLHLRWSLAVTHHSNLNGESSRVIFNLLNSF